MTTEIVGWDIGGAHVKAVFANGSGEIIGVNQVPCQLWKGIDRLRAAVGAVLADLPGGTYRHAITMTGELVDGFVGRDEGVRAIIEAMSALLSSSSVEIYAGNYGFVGAARVDHSHYAAIASANWLATATFVAQRIKTGVLVDIGSTTVDILPMSYGKVLAEGNNDYERLLSRELVYTGIIRTPVMAIADLIEDQGRSVGLMAEHFATMADVYRLTGELNELHDQSETADGAEKSVTASARRVARMLGCDYDPDEIGRWVAVANSLRARQIAKISMACEQQIGRAGFSNSCPIVGAGVGRFLVSEIALKMERPYIDISTLLPSDYNNNGITAADCAPAAAVALLSRRS